MCAAFYGNNGNIYIHIYTHMSTFYRVKLGKLEGWDTLPLL